MGYALIALGMDIALTSLGLLLGLIWQKIIDKKKEKQRSQARELSN